MRLKRTIVFFVFLLPLYSALGQIVIVRDKESNLPIENVLIFDQGKKRSVQTTTQGKADITSFGAIDIIYFRHAGYSTLSLSMETIRTQNNLILLTPSILSFDEVVISANKWEQDSREIPNKIISISSEDISFKNPQTSADLLASTGEVFIQKSQLGGGSPMLRGFAANRVLIVVDGVRMNNAIFRNGNLQNVISIDPNSLEGAEVLLGPGSVIYGSDALGGVMDFHTKRLEFSTSSKVETEVNALLRTSSANFEKTGHLDFSISGRKLSTFSSISYSDFDDLRAGSNRPNKFPDFGKRIKYIKTQNGIDQVVQNENINKQIFSGYNQLNLMQKIKWKPSENLNFVYSIQHASTSDIPRYDRLIQKEDNGTLAFAVWKYGPQKWTSHVLNTSLFKDNLFFNQARLSLNYQAIEESRLDRRLGNDLLRKRTEQVKVYALNMDFEKSINEDVQFFYGLEAFNNDISSEGITTNIENGSTTSATPRYPDGGSNFKSMAAYLSFKGNLNKKISLSFGIRYSNIQLNAKISDQSSLTFPFDEFELKNDAFNGSLGFTYRTNESTQLNFLASSGFRAPNIDDAGKVFEGVNNNVVVPNITLQSEYSYNLEIGLKKAIANKVQAEATGFVSFLTDAIVRRDFLFNGLDSIVFDGEKLKVQALVNTGGATIYGGSVMIKAELYKSLFISSTLTAISGEDQDALPLRHVTPLFGESKLRYKSMKATIELSSRYSGGIDFEDLAPSEQDKAYLYTSDGSLGWSTLNLRASYALSDLLLISGAVENILDKHYRPYSSGISAPGINFVLSAKVSF